MEPCLDTLIPDNHHQRKFPFPQSWVILTLTRYVTITRGLNKDAQRLKSECRCNWFYLKTFMISSGKMSKRRLATFIILASSCLSPTSWRELSSISTSRLVIKFYPYLSRFLAYHNRRQTCLHLSDIITPFQAISWCFLKAVRVSMIAILSRTVSSWLGTTCSRALHRPLGGNHLRYTSSWAGQR